MNIDKTQIRIMAANASGRLSDAKQSVFYLESILNDVKIKLENAKDAKDRAEISYAEIMAMIASIEDAE